MNSNINTRGRVIVSGNKASLLGGKICAIKGVDTYNLGNRLHLKTVLDIGRNELYAKVQAKYAADREQLLEELDALEKMRRKIRMLCASGREVPEDQQRKVFAAIEVKTHALAELDGESAKLANLTEQTMKEPIRVRGRASMMGIRGQLDHDQRHLIPPAVGGEKGGLQTPEQAGCHGGAVSARQYPVPFGIVIVPKNL